MDPLDKLLAELKAENAKDSPSMPAAPPSEAKPGASIADLLNAIDAPTVRSEPTTELQVTPAPASLSLPEIPNSKSSLPGSDRPQPPETQESDSEESDAKQERAKQKRLEHLRQQRRSELREPARKWLSQLKPKSDEGVWFEEFACNYESRLEAAIEYLEALQEVEREGRKF
jgi:hypothetical protein